MVKMVTRNIMTCQKGRERCGLCPIVTSYQGLLYLEIYEKKLYALLRQLKNAISLLIQILEMKMDFIEEKFLIIES